MRHVERLVRSATPSAVADTAERAVLQHSERGDLLYRFRHGFESPVQCTSAIIVLLPVTATTRDARRGDHPDW